MFPALFVTTALFASMPSLELEAEGEIGRIQRHLGTVEALLRERSVAQLSAAQREERARLLDVLREYTNAGSFPLNTEDPGYRVPVFIDVFATPCAVAWLMMSSGASELAEEISRSSNGAYVDQLHDPRVPAWAERVGFELAELSLIQPTYSKRDPYWEAAHAGDLEKIQALYAKHGDPSAKWRVSLLALTAGSGNAEAVRWLLSKKADPNKPLKGRGDVTALTFAMHSQNVEVVRVLLAAGADPETKSQNMSPLYHAVTGAQSSAMVKLLLEYKAKPDQARCDQKGAERLGRGQLLGETALQAAVRFGDEESVRLLLEAGADPQARGGLRYSAIELAQAQPKIKRLFPALKTPVELPNPKVQPEQWQPQEGVLFRYRRGRMVAFERSPASVPLPLRDTVEAVPSGQ